jgi:surface antigen
MPVSAYLACTGRCAERVFANKLNSGVKDMATTKTTFETIPAGTDVTWHYRSAIGHGTVIGVHKIGTTADNTMYSVRQHDHHPGEPDILHHSGKALSRVDS